MSVITNQTLTLTITSGSIDTVIRKDNCRVDVFGDYVRLTDYTGERYEFLFSDITTPSTTSAVELAQAIEEFLNTGGSGGGGNVDSVTGAIVDNTDPSNPVVGLGYLRLSFNLTQSRTDAPVVTEFINETGIVLTPEYNSVGTYLLNFSQTIDQTKAQLFVGTMTDSGFFTATIGNSRMAIITTDTTSATTDEFLLNTAFELRFFPGWDA